MLVVAALVAGCSDEPQPSAGSNRRDAWARFVVGSRPAETSGFVEAVARVNAGGNGVWLALGSSSAGPGLPPSPAAWASGDDRNWRSIAVPVSGSGSSTSSSSSVGALPGVLTAAASDKSSALIGGAVGSGVDAAPAVWTSTTGYAWTGPIRLPVSARPGRGTGGVVRSIARGPGGWVASGGAAAGGGAGPLLWFSPDGTNWSEVVPDSIADADTVWQVSASTDRFVAVASPTTLPAVTDGGTSGGGAGPVSTRGAVPGASTSPASGSGSTAVAAPGSTTPGASGPPGGAVVLSSTDGRSWRTHPLDGFAQPIVARSVTRVRDRFVVAVDCCGEAARLAVSTDGERWSPGAPLPVITGPPAGGAANTSEATAGATTATGTEASGATASGTTASGTTASGTTATTGPGTIPARPVTQLAERDGHLVAWAGRRADLWLFETRDDVDLGDATAAADTVWRETSLPHEPIPSFDLAPPGYGTGRIGVGGPTVVVERPGRTETFVWWRPPQAATQTDAALAWHKAVVDIAPAARRTSERIVAMAVKGGQVVAVGEASGPGGAVPGGAGDDGGQARLWVTAGSVARWDDITVNANVKTLTGVAADADRIVAVGRRRSRHAPDGPDEAAVVVGDGSAFGEVTPPTSLADQLPLPVPSTAPAGSAAPPGTKPPAGRQLFDGAIPEQVVHAGDRFYARVDDGTVWESPDGESWSHVDGVGDTHALCAQGDQVVAPPYRLQPGEGWARDDTLLPAGLDPPAVCAVAVDGSAVVVADARSSWLVTAGATRAVVVPPATTIGGVAWIGGVWYLLGTATSADAEGDPVASTFIDPADDWAPIPPVVQLGRLDGPGGLAAAVGRGNGVVLGGTQSHAATVFSGPP